MPFKHDELTIYNIKDACKKYPGPGLCDVLAGELRPSCNKMAHIPSKKVFYVRFVKAEGVELEEEESRSECNREVPILSCKTFFCVGYLGFFFLFWSSKSFCYIATMSVTYSIQSNLSNLSAMPKCYSLLYFTATWMHGINSIIYRPTPPRAPRTTFSREY